MTFKQIGWILALMNLAFGVLNLAVYDNAPTGAANLFMFIVVTVSLLRP